MCAHRVRACAHRVCAQGVCVHTHGECMRAQRVCVRTHGECVCACVRAHTGCVRAHGDGGGRSGYSCSAATGMECKLSCMCSHTYLNRHAHTLAHTHTTHHAACHGQLLVNIPGAADRDSVGSVICSADHGRTPHSRRRRLPVLATSAHNSAETGRRLPAPASAPRLAATSAQGFAHIPDPHLHNLTTSARDLGTRLHKT